MNHVRLICWSLLALGGSVPTLAADLTISPDFPGGNVLVDRIDGDNITLRPDLRDTKGDWFYWSFRVQNAAGRTLTFTFAKGQPVGVRGPAISTDNRKTWRWLGQPDKPSARAFTHTFAPTETDVYFGVGMTYTQQDFDAFVKPFADHPNLRRETLCKSNKGRDVEKLRLGKLDGEPKHRLLLTARHHACEMMASYAVEGVIAAVLADDDTGRWFRDNVELMIIPFVDKDGVELGDQGKNRNPRDHNRDYDGQSLYAETRTLRELVPKWSDGKLIATVDLHCPTLRGFGNEFIYQVGQERPHIWEAQQRLGNLLEKTRTGPLVYKQSNDFPFGKGWNTAGNYKAGTPVGRWGGSLEGVKLATTFEIPYANASGEAVTAESGRAFGRDLARALREFLSGAK